MEHSIKRQYLEQQMTNTSQKLHKIESETYESNGNAYSAKLEFDRAKRHYDECLAKSRLDQAKHLEIKHFHDQLVRIYNQFLHDQGHKEQEKNDA